MLLYYGKFRWSPDAESLFMFDIVGQVDQATRLLATGCTVAVVEDFFSLLRVQSGPTVHPASCKMLSPGKDGLA